MTSAVTPQTFTQYSRMFDRYSTFCIQLQLRIWPASEDKLILFCTFLSRSVQHSTIRAYLSGIRFFAILHGRPFSIIGMERLYYVLRGIKRLYTVHRLPRAPITPAHLVQIHTQLQLPGSTRLDGALYWAACNLAYFGLLRVSEYTCSRINSYNPDIHLLVSDITVSCRHITVLIKASKTDPFRQGCHIRIAPSYTDFCPVLAIQHYLRIRPFRVSAPLFIFDNGTFLTRLDVSLLLQRSLPNSVNINTHSFRIGGASATASAGVSDSVIKILGRWSSDAYKRYIRVSDSILRAWSVNIANVDSLTVFWDFENPK